MRFIPRKRISELEALDSASVNTYVVGIDGGVTYKIGINEITDLISANITGSNGTSGTSGLNGTSGTSAVGINGNDGTSGTNGTGGTSGTTGTSGTSAVGSSGTDGTSGTSGTNGTSGTTGIAGTSGTSGFSINSASFATTGSNIFNGDQIITGSLNISGTITANEYHTTIISSSVLYTSGSTKFGDTWDDEHEFTGSVKIAGNQTILGFVTASSYLGDGRYLTNLPATTNWNYNQEFQVKKTEQLTFSGDYILENTYLQIEGGTPNSIGEWEYRVSTRGGGISKTSNNTYLIEGPNFSGGASDGTLLTRYFDTETTMSVAYVWNSNDAGNEFAVYDITTGINNYPYEIGTPNMLQNPNASNESGTWIINVPADSYLTFAVWSGNSDNLSSTLQITLPYLFGEDVQYSSNKYFKKEGTIFIGGNLLVKDSYIQNDGMISVAGEVILIGNSQIEGTGTII